MLDERGDAPQAALLGGLDLLVPDGRRDLHPLRAVGRRGRADAVLLPSPEHPRQLVVPGLVPGLLHWQGSRQTALTCAARTPVWRWSGRPGVALPGGRRSLLSPVTPVGTALQRAAAALGRLESVHALLLGDDRLVAQVRLSGRLVALRLAEQRGRAPWQPVHEPGELIAHLPPVLGEGLWGMEDRVLCWQAEQWLPGRPGPGGPSWRLRPLGPAWAALRGSVRAVAATPTGIVTAQDLDGLAAVTQVEAPAHAEAVARAMAPLAEAGWPTAWCHGDPAPENSLWDGRAARLVDWEGARRNAPSGVDVLVLESVLLRARRRVHTTGAGLAVLTAEPWSLTVAGRSWPDVPAELRRAVATAALLVNGHAGSGRRPPGWWVRNLVDLLGPA